MELLLINYGGKVRREQHLGRDFVVAPLTMIVEGVLNGSQGALYYPQDEISKTADAWNGMPIVVYHPTSNGKHVSARSPNVLNQSYLGNVYNSRFEDGKLTAEGWFDIELVKKVDERVYNALMGSKPLELSTGLFTDNHPAKAGATWNGKSYAYTARRYRPDHLAILPDQVGACSIQDGCGVLNNSPELQTAVINERKSFLKKMAEFLGLSENAEGHWITTEDGNRLFISDGVLKTGPNGKEISSGGKKSVGKGDSNKSETPKTESEKKPEGLNPVKVNAIHTSDKYISKFDDDHMGTGTDGGYFGKGIYFSPVDGTSAYYGNKVTNVELNFKNMASYKNDIVGKVKGIHEFNPQARNREHAKKITEYAISKGFDGIHVDLGDAASHEYVVFSSKSIKVLPRNPTGNTEEGEACPHCQAMHERGDNGNCNRCGKPWPTANGGAGSGNFGHSGRPGEQGGSAEGSGGGPLHGEVRKGSGQAPKGGLEDLVEIGTTWSGVSSDKDVPGPSHITRISEHLKEAGITQMGSSEGKSTFKLDPEKLKQAFANADLLNKLTGNEREVIEEVAKLRGFVLPDAWNSVTNKGEVEMPQKLTDEQRTKIVDGLCTNCKCQTANLFTADDKEMISEFTDERLIALNNQRTAIASQELVVNSAREIVGKEVALNAMPQALKEAMKRKEESTEEEGEVEDKVPTGNKGIPVAPLAKPLSDAEFLKIAPPSLKATLNRLSQMESREKARLIGLLTANVAEEQRETISKLYQQMPVENLETLVAALPLVENEYNGYERELPPQHSQSYLGLGSGFPTGNRGGSDKIDKDDLLLPPVINWQEEDALIEA